MKMDYTMKAIINCVFISLIYCIIKGTGAKEDCDLPKVNKCFSESEFDMTVLSKDKTNFCNVQLRDLQQCLEAHNTTCFNEPQYQLNIQSFSPSVFGCEGTSGLQCDLKAVQSCALKLDISKLSTNVTLFCNTKLRSALSCVEMYKDVCTSSSHSRLFNAIVSTLQPELYGCSGSVGEQCELFSVAGCIQRFNIYRMHHLEGTGNWMFQEALCQHLRTTGCVAPFERACKNNPSFATIKTNLDLNQCIVTEKPQKPVVLYINPVNHDTSSSTRPMLNELFIGLSFSVIFALYCTKTCTNFMCDNFVT